MRLHLIVTCVLSCAVHTGFFLFIAIPVPRLLTPPDTLAEVQLVTVEEPEPPTPQASPPDKTTVPGPTAAALPVYDPNRIVPPDVQQIDGMIAKMSAGLSMRLTPPKLTVPTQRQQEILEEPIMPLTPDAAGVARDVIEASPVPTGALTAMETQIGLGQVQLGTQRSPSRLGLPYVDPALVAPPQPTALPVATLPPPEPAFGIEGPVAEREPLFRPPLPTVKVLSESTIMLKFWVRPDGVVTRIVPERKGDAVLEAAAMRYLEGWRFTPLTPREPQEEQWGTITVRFLPPTR